MRRAKQVCIIVLILIMFSNCQKSSKTYFDNEYGFFFEYPSDWSATNEWIVENEPYYYQVLLYEPFTDEFTSHILIEVKNNQNISLNQRADMIELELNTSYEYRNNKILDKKEGRIQNEKAIIFECIRPSGDYIIRYRKVILNIEDSFYDITMRTTSNEFDKMNAVFTDFIDSFSLKEQPQDLKGN